MKIAIPVENKKIDSSVSLTFGRAPYFLIYDMEKKESSFIENSAAGSTGGAGIKAAQIIVDNNVEVLLTMRLGENASEVLKSADIRIYKTIDGSIKENIDAFAENKLFQLDKVHAGFQGQQQIK
ncbi:MAG: NifB/NifX family molybdenum-iron cluster-binding protein [Erysipelotrichaceae bacterium]|jgi:predicted Fe-Mo cluster-binding NifX family protein